MATRKQDTQNKGLYLLALARISLGLTFLWAFFDKLFGLGFATCRDAATNNVSVMCDSAWLQGGSPTTGFLKFATKGPFQSFYSSLAGNNFIDILFMAGLLLIGFALVAGIGMKLATTTGSLLMLMMWSAGLWPANNPILDEHIVYIFILLALLSMNSQQVLGLRSWWIKQSVVKRFSFLE